jgi:hypothetical protein
MITGWQSNSAPVTDGEAGPVTPNYSGRGAYLLPDDADIADGVSTQLTGIATPRSLPQHWRLRPDGLPDEPLDPGRRGARLRTNRRSI